MGLFQPENWPSTRYMAWHFHLKTQKVDNFKFCVENPLIIKFYF